MKKYTITDKEKQQYAAILLLDEMINGHIYFPIIAETKNQEYLEPVFVQMLFTKLIDIKDNKYVPTEEGRKKLQFFYEKFAEYINIYDVFSTVDLEVGEFAFSSWFDIDDDGEWEKFLKEERFEDVRVAVCEFKGINPIEIVFLSYIASKDFDLTTEGWEFELLYGTIWDDIVEICNTNIHAEQLIEQDAMEAIVEQGFDVIRQQKVAQTEIDAECDALDAEIENFDDGNFEDDYEGDYEEYVTVVEEVVYENNYYDPYYDDIYYVSPLWISPIIIF